MRKAIHILLVGLAAIGLVGCATPPTPPYSLTVTDTPVNVTAFPSSVLTSTIQPTPTSIATATEKPSSSTTELKHCIHPDHPTPLTPSQPLIGTFLFTEAGKITTFDGGMVVEKELIDLTAYEHFQTIGLSPNGEWFAFGTTSYPPTNLDEITIYLLSNTGDIKSVTLSNFPEAKEIEYWNIGFWLDNEQISITGFTAEKTLSVFAAYNLFKATWNSLLIETLPNRFWGGVSISPDLTQALYLSGGNNTDPESHSDLVFWDVESQHILWQKEYFSLPLAYGIYTFLHPVAWTRDSSKVAFVFNEADAPSPNVYILDREGGEPLLIPSEPVPPESPDLWPAGFEWSPDGQYLAYVTASESDPSQQAIVIYDVAKNFSTDMCIHDRIHNILTGTFVWSPDSRYLVFGQGEDFHSESNQIVMLDIYTGEVTLLKKGAWVMFVGWSSVENWKKP